MRQAHAMKGAAANINAGTMRQLALEMETLGRAKDLQGMRDHLQGLTGQFEDLKAILLESFEPASVV
jgi:HPt (histidine-containing phosphotransfer) domain-containing protein